MPEIQLFSENIFISFVANAARQQLRSAYALSSSGSAAFNMVKCFVMKFQTTLGVSRKIQLRQEHAGEIFQLKSFSKSP